MKKFYPLIKTIIYMLSSLIILSLLITILSYFSLINNSIFKVLKLLVPLITIFISSYILAKNTKELGIITGIKLALPTIGIMFLISLFTKNYIKFSVIFYYMIILLFSLLGSIVSKNKIK